MKFRYVRPLAVEITFRPRLRDFDSVALIGLYRKEEV